MQHVIIDKTDTTKIILNESGKPQINGSRKELTDKEAYFNFDDTKHIHARGPKPLPEHWILEDGIIREKKLSEKISDRIVIVDEGYILDVEEIRPMTNEEKLTAGLMTQEEYDDIIVVTLINSKLAEISQEEYETKRNNAIEKLKTEGKLKADGKLKNNMKIERK